jgi:hypothetical protein
MLKVIVVATNVNGYIRSLMESANRHDYDLIILGINHKWHGYGWRLNTVLEYLRNLPSDEVVMIMDAYDTILLRPSSDAIQIWENLNVKFLCGAFRKTSGILGFIQDQEFGLPIRDLNGNTICAGTIMTTAGYALEAYDGYDIRDDSDDQVLLNVMYDENDDIVADTNFEIFCTIFPYIFSKDISDSVHVDGERLICDITNTEPIAIHGIGNVNLSPILQELNFVNCNDLTGRWFIINKLWYHTKLVVKMIIGNVISYFMYE